MSTADLAKKTDAEMKDERSTKKRTRASKMGQRSTLAALAVVTVSACSDNAQELIGVDLLLRGTAREARDLSGGGTIELSQADLAFGPLYLCSGTQAGELCESARLEWLESAVLDALEEEPQLVGRLEGLSGSVRSWMYDHAFTSTRSAARPIELSAATQLGGNSLRLAGIVEHGALIVPFATEFAIALSDDVEPGFPVVRSSATSNLELSAETSSLEIQFQTESWLSALRLSDFYQELDCDAQTPVTCQGAVQQSCDENGALLAETDCTLAKEVCAPFVGCAAKVELAPESRAVRAIQQEIIAGARPDFRLR